MRTQGPFLNFQPLSLKYFSHPPDFPNTGFPTPPPLSSAISPAKAATPLSLSRNGRGYGGRGLERAAQTPPAAIPAPLPHPHRHPHPGAKLHPTFTPTCTVPRHFGPSVAATFPGDQLANRSTNLQTDGGRRGGNRGNGVLGGRSSTRDTSALILEPFFPRSLCTSHSLPSPAARSPPILPTKMGMRRGTAVFRK